MDLNRLFGMLTRMFISTAVDKGIEFAASRGKPESEMTPEERKQAQTAKETAQRTKRLMRMGRKLFR